MPANMSPKSCGPLLGLVLNVFRAQPKLVFCGERARVPLGPYSLARGRTLSPLPSPLPPSSTLPLTVSARFLLLLHDPQSKRMIRSPGYVV